MEKKTSPHILGTASSLLGICLVVITAINFADKAHTSVIDEITSVVAIVLTMACFVSFLSIQVTNLSYEQRLERIANGLFIISMVGIFAIIVGIALESAGII